MDIIVNCQTCKIIVGEDEYSCRIGCAGAIEKAYGREGDQKTPMGTYRIRFGFYRQDKLPSVPPGMLNWHSIMPNDGWCDDPLDPAYNRFVRLPYEASAEKLWRDDGVYDIILIMDHNDSPPQQDLGSAIFIHIARPDNKNTLGCVAITPDVMVRLLTVLDLNSEVKII